jgi:FOG: HEAT repeat
LALSRLETEESGQNRKIVMRLISQLGTSALEAARLRVQSGTWYIVRNVCTVLQELRDPDLAQDLRPALVHDDARVQQAAFHAVTKARAANRAEVLANCLISFHPHVLELALDEITFLKDPKSLQGLNFFASSSSGRSATVVMKAIAALRAIGGEGAMTGLGRILKDPGAPLAARKQAMEALRWSMHPAAKVQLDDFASSPDPLAREYMAKATGR